MKITEKKIISLVMSAMIIFGIFSAAYGQHYPYSLSNASMAENAEGISASVNITKNDAADGGLAVMAFYKKGGALMKIVSADVTAEEGEEQAMTVSLSKEEAEAVTETKAFIWNSLSGMKPLSESVSIQSTESDSGRYFFNAYSDINGTESYAEAVNLVSKLKIMSGYADGTFRPDASVTRVEAAAIAVKLLNKEKVAKVLSDSTAFDDVEVGNELCGIVNYCTQMNIISADGNKFLPNENVTYRQFIEIMINALGYQKYAELQGGWPIGYLGLADDLGILDGIDSTGNSLITRAEAARMIYNSSFAPITEITGYEISNGQYFPIIEVQDGRNGREFETWLTKYHKAYYVEGHISSTYKTNPARFSRNEAEFTIEYTENYNDSMIVIERGSERNCAEVIGTGGIEADEYLFVYASAIVQIENGTAEFISFVPSGKNNIKAFDSYLIDDASYYDDEDTDYNDQTTVFTVHGAVQAKPYVKYYETKSSLKSDRYNLSRDFRLYVNGIMVTANMTDFENYVVNNAGGKVKLIDMCSAGQNADGYYDYIFVDYYATAKINTVKASADKINFDAVYNNDGVTSLILDEDCQYKIIYNGETIGLADLQTGDVLSIGFDTQAGFGSSDFYDIYVSRGIVSGKYIAKYADKETIKINNTEYEFVMGYQESEKMALGNEYDIYLDIFGRIFAYEPVKTSVRLAVIEKYTKSSADDYYKALLYTADGDFKSVEVDTTKVVMNIEGTSYRGNEVNDKIKEIVYTEPYNSKSKNPIENRVFKYKISASSGKIVALEKADIASTAETQIYEPGLLGTVAMNQATKVIDAKRYNNSGSIYDLSVTDINSFISGERYSAFAYGERDTDGGYPFVIVTKGSVHLTEEKPDTVSEEKYGIIEKYLKSSADDYYRALLYTADGEAEKLEVDTTKVTNLENEDILKKVYKDINGNGTIDPSEMSSDNKTDIQNRVVKYKTLSLSGRIVSLEFTDIASTAETQIYEPGFLGTVTMNQATKVIDAIRYNNSGSIYDLSVTDINSFISGEGYSAFAYGERDTDGGYPFVIVTKGSVNLTEEKPDTVSEERYGIIEKYTKSSADDYYRVLLYTDDGKAENLEVDTTKVTNLKNEDILEKVYKDINGNGTIDPSEMSSDNKTDIQNRVVKYKTSSLSGRIVSLEFTDIEAAANGQTFNKNMLGAIKIDSTTKVIDAIEYSALIGDIPDYSYLYVSSAAEFLENIEYTAYAYGVPGLDGAYPFVIVTDAGGTYNYQTNIAVLTNKPGVGIDEYGEYFYTIEVLFNGEHLTGETALIANGDVLVNGADGPVFLNRGDIIVFDKDNEGHIKTIDVLMAASKSGIDNGYDAVVKNAFRNTELLSVPVSADNWTGLWINTQDPGIDLSKEITQIVYGPIVDNKNSYFTLGSIGTVSDVTLTDSNSNEIGYSGLYTDKLKDGSSGGIINIDITDDTNIYVCDYGIVSHTAMFSVGSNSSIQAGAIADSLIYNHGDFIPWDITGVKDGANFAFAKVVDGSATDVFVIIAG